MKTYATAAAFRRALEDRLNRCSKEEGIDLQRIRRQVAFDRLLVRLFLGEHPPWRLKGGYALELKLDLARTTRDLDLGLTARDLGVENALEVLQEAAGADTGDHFVFVIGEPTMDLDGAPYGGSRFPVEAKLDGRNFARFHLDLGFGDIQREPCEWTPPREWLGFAGIESGSFPSISREEHFAQKLHAYTMPRRDRPNTRVKDLVDLVLLIDAGGLDEERLRRDVADTFRRRATHEVPEVLEDPPEFWGPVFAKLAEECGISVAIDEHVPKVKEFFLKHCV